MIESHPAFLDNNTNLKCIQWLNKATLHNKTLPLIINQNSNNKVCIPKDITKGTSEEMSNDCYSINEIILIARPSDIKSDAKPVKSIANSTQKRCNINTIFDLSSVISHKENNTLKYLNIIKGKDVKQLPNPLSKTIVIILPAEVACHRKVKFTGATIKNQRDNFASLIFKVLNKTFPHMKSHTEWA